jgi:hypothetical protein
MKVISLPAVDTSPCGGWSPQERGLYARIPEYYEKGERKRRARFGNYRKYMGKKKSEVGKADNLFTVYQEPPPQIRQFARPADIKERPKVDVTQWLDSKVPYSIAHHRFESPVMHWLPSFEDWMKQKLDPSFKYVLEEQERYTYLFHRTFMIDSANYVYIAGHGLVEAPPKPNEGKDIGWWQDAVRKCKAPLSLSEVVKCQDACENEVGMVPYQSGSVKDDHFINDKFCLHTSGQVYNRFIEDPYLQKYKTDNLNIVTDGFRGMPGGTITSVLHSHPLRFLQAANGTLTTPAPETIVNTPSSFEFRRTVPAKPYATDAQVEVSMMMGHMGYEVLDAGPPPADFTKKRDQRVNPITWNGRPFLTDNITIPEYNEAMEIVNVRSNSYGEFIQILSWLSLGIAPVDIRQCVPIIHLRHGRTLAIS